MTTKNDVVKNEIMKRFDFEGNQVEIIIENGEPLFEVYSTGMALGQVKKNANGISYPFKDRIDKNLKNAEITPCVRNVHKFISESQLYDLMLEVKTDKVRKFRKWVTNELLPTIRKTGGYVVEGHEAEFIEKYFPSFSDDVKKAMVLDLHGQNKLLKKENKQLSQKIEDDRPLVEFAETVTDSSDAIDMGDLAKLVQDEHIDIGRNRLFKWLREQNILMKDNVPYQSAMNKGWFKVIETPYQTPYGTKLGTKTLVTGKGQVAIVEKLRKEFVA